MKFKVGDRVIVVRCRRRERELHWRGVIVKLHNSESVYVMMGHDERLKPLFYLNYDLELEHIWNSPLYKALS